MTRWGMVADLERCVGCQTCTAACKHVNATSPAVQWRKVLDLEVGAYPDVKRVFVPVGCMHCEDPPCMHVCPSTATGQRKDGIVTIDYELCIGCAYCAVACPYQARYKVDGPNFASGSGNTSFAYGNDGQMKNEARREDPARLGVAQKCTFCSDRIDHGMENNLTPGIDPEATPACANACIAGALHFGDLDDPDSNVSNLLNNHRTFAMHAELDTKPGFHYIWKRHDSDGAATESELPINMSTGIGGVGAAEPWLQQHWDWRAAGNFMGGGTGSGMMIALAALSLLTPISLPLVLLALASVAGGLFLVWLETGRPFRAPLNVLYNARTSWMTREAMVGSALFPFALLAGWWGTQLLFVIAGLSALAFLYCQAQILKAAKGIPAWREPAIVNLVISTGLCEGAGLLLATSILFPLTVSPQIIAIIANGLVLLIALRMLGWRAYREALKKGAPVETLNVVGDLNLPFIVFGHMLPLLMIASGYVFKGMPTGIYAFAGLLAFAAGWVLKFCLITKAAYNQGYAINFAPERGSGGGGPGGQPGWGKAA
jgi:phenylacetyl-CoA:acceptor oxidoreductase subunit 1